MTVLVNYKRHLERSPVEVTGFCLDALNELFHQYLEDHSILIDDFNKLKCSGDEAVARARVEMAQRTICRYQYVLRDYIVASEANRQLFTPLYSHEVIKLWERKLITNHRTKKWRLRNGELPFLQKRRVTKQDSKQSQQALWSEYRRDTKQEKTKNDN